MVSLAFHNADRDISANGKIFDWAIKFRTGSPLVHVEIVFGEPSKNSLCCSAVPKEGVRLTRLDLTGPEWVVVEMPGVDSSKIWNAAQKYLGQKYDWVGIVGFASPWGLHDDDDKFCSELCLQALQDCGLFLGPKPWRTSPAALYDLVAAKKQALAA